MSPVTHPPKLIAYGVGSPSPFNSREEGAAVQLAPTGITVVLNIADPTPSEILALKAKNPARMGVMNHDRLGFFVMDFGGILKFDAPFDVGIQRPASLFDLELPTPNSRFGITVFGVNTTTNKVFALRSFSLSPRVSRQVSQLLKRQIAAPISRAENLAMIDYAYEKYPNTAELISRTKEFDLLGSDDSSLGS